MLKPINLHYVNHWWIEDFQPWLKKTVADCEESDDALATGGGASPQAGVAGGATPANKPASQGTSKPQSFFEKYKAGSASSINISDKCNFVQHLSRSLYRMDVETIEKIQEDYLRQDHFYWKHCSAFTNTIFSNHIFTVFIIESPFRFLIIALGHILLGILIECTYGGLTWAVLCLSTWMIHFSFKHVFLRLSSHLDMKIFWLISGSGVHVLSPAGFLFVKSLIEASYMIANTVLGVGTDDELETRKKNRNLFERESERVLQERVTKQSMMSKQSSTSKKSSLLRKSKAYGSFDDANGDGGDGEDGNYDNVEEDGDDDDDGYGGGSSKKKKDRLRNINDIPGNYDPRLQKLALEALGVDLKASAAYEKCQNKREDELDRYQSEYREVGGGGGNLGLERMILITRTRKTKNPCRLYMIIVLKFFVRLISNFNFLLLELIFLNGFLI